jgi:hypothetical protein
VILPGCASLPLTPTRLPSALRLRLEESSSQANPLAHGGAREHKSLELDALRYCLTALIAAFGAIALLARSHAGPPGQSESQTGFAVWTTAALRGDQAVKATRGKWAFMFSPRHSGAF